jgi:hypothetical protein
LKLNRCIITGIASASSANRKAGNRKLIFLTQCFVFACINKPELLYFLGNKNKKTGKIIGNNYFLFAKDCCFGRWSGSDRKS